MSSPITTVNYRLNGVVSTDKPVLENLKSLVSSMNAWLTYDTSVGKWGVVINQAGNSIASFDDSNIIGSISISGSSLTDINNSVRVEFPHIDLNDKRDFVQFTVPLANQFPNEPGNQKLIQFDNINDPTIATVVGYSDLTQSRLDKVIRFRTDFSKIGLLAGDIIDVTNDIYGFTNKKFRIISVTESDGDDGSFSLEITALEYSDSVYDYSGLYTYERTNSTGIDTLGNIGIPGTPNVIKYEYDARPRVVVSSTAPSGVVNGMEFWYTTDTAIGNDNLRTYKLIDTIRPIQSNANANVTTFSFGDNVTAISDSLSAGNLLFKTRGINSYTAGPFSPAAGLIYTPVQTTQAIDQNTVVSDGAGGILTTLSVLALLNNLDQLFGGNISAGSLYDKIFSLFQDDTGVNIIDSANNFATSSNIQVLENGFEITPKLEQLNFSGDFQISYTGGDVEVSVDTGNLALAIEDHGNAVTNSVSSINFTGAGATVSNIGSNVTVTFSGLTVANIGDLNDVDTTTVAPVTGSYLYWDGTEWRPESAGSGPGGSNYYSPDTGTGACGITQFGLGTAPSTVYSYADIRVAPTCTSVTQFTSSNVGIYNGNVYAKVYTTAFGSGTSGWAQDWYNLYFASNVSTNNTYTLSLRPKAGNIALAKNLFNKSTTSNPPLPTSRSYSAVTSSHFWGNSSVPLTFTGSFTCVNHILQNIANWFEWSPPIDTFYFPGQSNTASIGYSIVPPANANVEVKMTYNSTTEVYYVESTWVDPTVLKPYGG